MVVYHVSHHPDVPFVSLLYQVLQVVITAEVGIRSVVVAEPVPVVRLRRIVRVIPVILRLFDGWRYPNRIVPHSLYVIQLRGYRIESPTTVVIKQTHIIARLLFLWKCIKSIS